VLFSDPEVWEQENIIQKKKIFLYPVGPRNKKWVPFYWEEGWDPFSDRS
jgi:hypothetical protein